MRDQEGVERIVPLGDAQVIVRFDYEAGYDDTRTEPGIPESIVITGVRVGLYWVSPDLFSDLWIQETEKSLYKRI